MGSPWACSHPLKKTRWQRYTGKPQHIKGRKALLEHAFGKYWWKWTVYGDSGWIYGFTRLNLSGLENPPLPTQRIDRVFHHKLGFGNSLWEQCQVSTGLGILLETGGHVITPHMHGLLEVVWYIPETQRPFTVSQNKQSLNEGKKAAFV